MLTVASDVSTLGLEIFIQDTGQGIKKEVMAELFTPFFTTKLGGMGLGLCLCKQVVEAHGGSVEIESEEEGGCRVQVDLPISSVDISAITLPKSADLKTRCMRKNEYILCFTYSPKHAYALNT